ncbi:MAG: transglutaminase-like domain-containing protein, partial [Desulfobia sp.]
FSLSLQDTTVIYKGREKLVINGRVRNLHRFQETFAGIRVSSWLNDKGDVVKEESPAGFTFVSEPEFQARDIRGADTELLSSVSAPLIKGKMPNLGSRSRISYRLHLPKSEDFDLQGGRQSFSPSSGRYGKADHETSMEADTGVLTIEKEVVPEQEALFCKNKKEYLQATPYIQADHHKIKSKAQEIVSREEPPLSQVKSITEWVYNYLDKKPVIGIPDAVTTLAGGRGDCNEHAVLFAALARSAGIPARIAAGVTFTVPSASYGKVDEEAPTKNGAFYYHAWNEVCLDGRWLSLDSTRNQVPADLGHIKFIQGDLEGQVRIGALLGKLKVEVLD